MKTTPNNAAASKDDDDGVERREHVMGRRRCWWWAEEESRVVIHVDDDDVEERNEEEDAEGEHNSALSRISAGPSTSDGRTPESSFRFDELHPGRAGVEVAFLLHPGSTEGATFSATSTRSRILEAEEGIEEEEEEER